MVRTAMMAFTHLLASLALATLVSPLVPESVGLPVVLATAVVGGLAPDLDLLARHRRTLHYPVGFPVLALVALGVFAATGVGAAFLLALGTAAAALHVLADLLGGSAEPAPWNPVTEFGVYNHVSDRWHRPRRVVQYSGSRGDFLLGTGCGLVALGSPVTAPAVDVAVAALVVAAGGYTLARRRLSTVASVGIGRLPPGVRRLVPAVDVEERDGGGTSLAVRFNR